jgi:hypothetical protein
MVSSNGISSSLGCFMTRRWRWWLRFISAYMIVNLEEVGLTSCGGCIQARVCSRLRPSIKLFRPQGLLHSLERAFGDLRLPLE